MLVVFFLCQLADPLSCDCQLSELCLSARFKLLEPCLSAHCQLPEPCVSVCVCICHLPMCTQLYTQPCSACGTQSDRPASGPVPIGCFSASLCITSCSTCFLRVSLEPLTSLSADDVSVSFCALIVATCGCIRVDSVCIVDDAWYWEHLDTSWAWNSYQGPQLQWLGTTDRHALHTHACNTGPHKQQHARHASPSSHFK